MTPEDELACAQWWASLSATERDSWGQRAPSPFLAWLAYKAAHPVRTLQPSEVEALRHEMQASGNWMREELRRRHKQSP